MTTETPMLKPKAAAVLTIREAGKMTPAGRRQIAAWLRHHANMLQAHGKDYSDRFTGRYLYDPKKLARKAAR